MSTELEKLQAAMDDIKAIMSRHDIAGAIVLTTPVPGSETGEFVTIHTLAVDKSYSLAKTMKHYCCPAHGVVEGIMVEARFTPDQAPVINKKVQQTLGMFMAMDKALIKSSAMCGQVLKEVSARIADAGKNKSFGTTDAVNQNMN